MILTERLGDSLFPLRDSQFQAVSKIGALFTMDTQKRQLLEEKERVTRIVDALIAEHGLESALEAARALKEAGKKYPIDYGYVVAEIEKRLENSDHRVTE